MGEPTFHPQLVTIVQDDPIERLDDDGNPTGIMVTGSHIEGELVCPDCGRDLISVGEALACGRLTVDQVYAARAELDTAPIAGDVFGCGGDDPAPADLVDADAAANRDPADG